VTSTLQTHTFHKATNTTTQHIPIKQDNNPSQYNENDLLSSSSLDPAAPRLDHIDGFGIPQQHSNQGTDKIPIIDIATSPKDEAFAL